MKFEVERRQRGLGILLPPRSLHHLEEVAAVPLRRAFHDNALTSLNRIERAGFYLPRLLRVFCTQLSIFRNVEPLESPRTQRRADTNAGPIAEFHTDRKRVV